MCAAFSSRHKERDLTLPAHRKKLLDNAVKDLAADPDVLAIYLGGSLAKGNFDNYSDIDLHTVVKAEKKPAFIEKKRNRAEKWGEVLFHEDANPNSSVVVSHYVCFLKIDSWYHAQSEISASIWLKNIQALYDPDHILNEVIYNSSMLSYRLEPAEMALWKAKVLAFAHEIYRAVMREETFYAEFNLDRLRWLIVSGWYKEMDEHFDASYGSWSKVEGARSLLTTRQLSLLKSWRCGNEWDETMGTLKNMVPELLRLNQTLSEKIGVEASEERFKSILDMSY